MNLQFNAVILPFWQLQVAFINFAWKLHEVCVPASNHYEFQRILFFSYK